MNRDDVIRWATQCKMPYDFVTGEIVQIEKLERFAALAYAAGAASGREACAKACEEDGLLWGQRYAAAIRARGVDMT